MTRIRKLGLMAAVIGIAGWHPSSHATGFAGVYAPANWTVTNNGGDGAVNTIGAPNEIVLTGNDAEGGGVDTDYITVSAGAGKVRFDWSYTTNDLPGFDGFGYLLGSTFTQLASAGGQSGTTIFDVALGDTFGFRVFSTDGCCGPGVATISNFSAPTPVPGPLPVLGVLAAFGFSRRLRARIHAARTA